MPPLAATNFSEKLPPNLSCGFCTRPIQKTFYRAMGRFTCESCAQQVQGHIDKNALTADSFLSALAVGLAAALAGAAAWAAVVIITHWNIGYLAAGIGIGVGKAMIWAAGQRRYPALRWAAAGLSVLGVALGKVAIVVWFVAEGLRRQTGSANPLDIAVNVPSLLVRDPIDLLWLAIAGYAAWRICRVPQIALAGPFAYNPQAPSSGGLRFDTVEPITPPSTGAARP
jgi:hypothetical protein